MDVPLPNFTQTLGPLGLDIPPAGETPFRRTRKKEIRI